MFRGYIKFHCTECGNNFMAPDFEYAASIYSMPSHAPNATVLEPCLNIV